ncbi:hypothetical protein ACFXNW_09075 [Nocardia sp. NPDC059180]|uniref:hypothetical protein n=1 Tax=Nocardia sp. NPDC059180 TaxID=3346761 RepID=UPI0036A4D1BE
MARCNKIVPGDLTLRCQRSRHHVVDPAENQTHLTWEPSMKVTWTSDQDVEYHDPPTGTRTTSRPWPRRRKSTPRTKPMPTVRRRYELTTAREFDDAERLDRARLRFQQATATDFDPQGLANLAAAIDREDQDHA